MRTLDQSDAFIKMANMLREERIDVACIQHTQRKTRHGGNKPTIIFFFGGNDIRAKIMPTENSTSEKAGSKS